MATVSPRAFQKRRRRPLLRALCACWRLAANTQLHAQEIWRAHLWPRLAYGARVEIGDLSGSDALERNQRGAISRACRASLRFPRGPFAGKDDGCRIRHAKISR